MLFNVLMFMSGFVTGFFTLIGIVLFVTKDDDEDECNKYHHRQKEHFFGDHNHE